ncbi:MAG: hypothetical protein NT070_11665 [Cyanobacteria bacterium]|nr:hypothetical protein [Cyanobacteriota bacterium]
MSKMKSTGAMEMQLNLQKVQSKLLDWHNVSKTYVSFSLSA